MSKNNNNDSKKKNVKRDRENTFTSKDIVDEIDKSLKENQNEKKPIKKSNFMVDFLSFILFIVCIIFFIINLFFSNNEGNNLFILVNSLLLLLFVICYIICSISYNRKLTKIGLTLLIIYFSFNTLINLGLISFNTFNKVDDFSNMNLSDVIKWASNNNITIDEEYEYSDMVSEYSIISQSVKAGTNLKDINEIKVAVSDGPNPSKSIVVPNMVTWDSERVINFILENHLSNVNVDFIESEEKQNTVIEQSYTGNMNRDDELNLTLSLGEELGFDEVKIIDFKNKSKIEIIFFCKQNMLEYEFKDGYSNKIKKGYAYKQSVKAGETVSINSNPIIVNISKGPKIRVPNLKELSLEKVTNWVIKNRLKIKITDGYDDSINENDIISTNYNKGDIISQGDTIEVVVSRGALKMKKFKSLDNFREWADKYNIKYEIQYEFSNTINVGDVISYSYKPGEVIKNNDSIIVKVSDGKKIEVPNLKGLTKNEAIKKLKEVGLSYNFVTKSSDTVPEGKVISQSLSAGSQVGRSSTITVTVSSGKIIQKKDNHSNNNNNNNNGGSNNNPTPPSNTCIPKTYQLNRDLLNIFNNYSGYSSVSSALYSYFSTNYPNVKISVVGVDGGDATSGSYVGGIGPGSSITSCNGVTYTIKIAK